MKSARIAKLSSRLSHTILIVDDDPQIRRLCRITLEEDGYVVKEANNGKEALAAIKETSVDLILLDLSMPDMDGFEFVKAIRSGLPEPTIITMSGFMGGALLPAARVLGGTSTLAKPFSPESLLSVVHKLLTDHSPSRPTD